MIRTGIIGFSEGNGHPFSFSAIVNGFDDDAFAAAGWPGIHEYLKAQGADRFGFPEIRVTHAWSQDAAQTRRLCAACRIGTACARPGDMLGAVDAVIIARDDWECHWPLAQPFLEAGIAVFVDKPLTLDPGELARFEPYLRRGRLMSCAGLRHARELDPLRGAMAGWDSGTPRLILATVLNGLEKYGIHMIEALSSLGQGFERPLHVTRLALPHDGFQIELANGVPVLLNCLGPAGKTFHLSVFGSRGHSHFDLHDNFSAFRRTLEHFFAMVQTGACAWDAEETLRLMQLIRTAGALAPGESARLA